MAKFIEQAALPSDTEALTLEQTGKAIEVRAQEVIANASLALVQQRMPQYVPVVEQMIAELDYTNPLTIPQAGSWALADQAQMGLELLEALQAKPGHEALLAVKTFETDLRQRVAPLQKRLNERSGKGVISRIFSAAKDIVVSTIPEGIKSKIDTNKIRTEMDELRDDDKLLGDIVKKTVADTINVKGLLEKNKHVPAIIQEQVGMVMESHSDAAEKLFLTLVAVNEYQTKITEETLPQLLTATSSGNALTSDVDTLQQARESLGLLETRRTDLTSAIVSTCLQRGMAAEMAKINATSAIEMERLGSIALPQMLGMLGTLALQQRTGELVASTKAANNIMASATESTARGFERVLDYSKQADVAKLNAASAVVRATDNTLKAIATFRTHEAEQIPKQRAAQAKLIEAVGKLRAAASYVETPKGGYVSMASASATAATDTPAPPRADAASMFARAKAGKSATQG